MASEAEELILKATGASRCEEMATLQSLWSGYGAILRFGLEGGDRPSVIVKNVSPPSAAQHPRGWNTDRSHARKLKSYLVESAWYQDYAKRCSPRSRVPECLAVARNGDEVILVLEDLDAAGFPLRAENGSRAQIQSCIQWLAEFHATFLHEQPDGLWETGTYWHLATRPDELAALPDKPLQAAAPLIDQRLQETRYQTFVQGDAKLANFCFSPHDTQVAAVDFQYVGGGCGIKDVAYFLGSCLHEDELAEQAEELLNFYFQELSQSLQQHHPPVDSDELVTEWRQLYPLAWADFHRFLKGWSPGHWKLNSYSEQMTARALSLL